MFSTDRAVEEILKRMWDNFEPDERVKKMMELEKKTHKISRRSGKWRPVVTVPEPFEMTVREERKMKEKFVFCSLYKWFLKFGLG